MLGAGDTAEAVNTPKSRRSGTGQH